jgi:mycoredoxin
MTSRNLVTFLIAAGMIFVIGKYVLAPSTEARTTDLHPESVVLYATDWCGYCKKTREFFNANNITYIEFDIEKSAEGKREYDQLKGNGVPLVVIKGNIIPGYNPSLMKKMLQI